jgi:hypothetical protein
VRVNVSAPEGDPPEFLEEMEIDDQAHFEREVEKVPEMVAMGTRASQNR